jgi:hypothetical protein
VTIVLLLLFPQRRRQKALSNILKAYSIFNVDIGYCQGMADIAALLVMYMEEEVRQTMPCPPKHNYSGAGDEMPEFTQLVC